MESFLHRVTQSGSFLRVDDLSELTDIAPPVVESIHEHGLHRMLTVPIQGKKTILGSLVIFYDAEMVGRSSINSLLTAICNQLGMSLDNLALWQEVRRKEAMRARLLAKIVSAQEEERQRISRELHDETGQALTSLLVQLKVLDRLPDISTMREHVVTLREIVASSLDEVRRLSLDLRPAVLDDLGLIPALEWYLNERVKTCGLSVAFEATDVTDWKVPPEIEVVLYRVAQEALTNISRYANASHATVKVENPANCLRLVVRDDGQGFDVDEVLGSSEHGLGLLGMKERVELIGGRFDIRSGPGEGTHIIVEIDPKWGD
jgi:signal transduction histidine kinase